MLARCLSSSRSLVAYAEEGTVTTQPEAATAPEAAAATASTIQPESTPAAAAEPASSSSASEDGASTSWNPGPLFVAKSSDPGKVAGALMSRLKANPEETLQLQASGRRAAYIAMLSLAYANNRVSMDQGRQLQYQPESKRPTVFSGMNAPEGTKVAQEWIFFVKLDPQQTPPPSSEIDMSDIAKVAEQTDPERLARVVEFRIKQEGKCVLQCVGEGSAYQALKAIKAARLLLVRYGTSDLYVVPERAQRSDAAEGGPQQVNRFHLFKCEARPQAVGRRR